MLKPRDRLWRKWLKFSMALMSKVGHVDLDIVKEKNDVAHEENV
jgi:hypothetical protein